MEETPGTADDGRPPRAGRRRFELAGYDVGDEIGRGAFGVVYRARDEAFDRSVAVKVLTVALDQDTQARFERECRSVGVVSGHPNIVTVHASGQDDMERPYLVMEFMDGGSLADRVDQEGPMPWREAVEIGVKLAGALETAHRAEILHRDVKPENVFISAYGEPKLGDFGISSLPGTRLTRSGVITATPLYGSPEVLNGQRASVASDVYSLGATLYCLLNGAPAFERDDDENTFALFYRVSTAPVPNLRPLGVPDDVCRMIETAMAKEPAERQQTAADFGEQLRRAQQAAGQPPTEMRVIVDRNATVLRAQAAPPGRATSTPPVLPAASDPLPLPRAPEPAGDSRRRVRVLVALLSVLALAVGAIALWPSATSDEDSPTLELDAVRHASGLVVDRTWALEGRTGDAFSSRVRVSNPTDKPVTYIHDEVVPKSLASSVDQIAFVPAPSLIVAADPVVRFGIPLIPGATFEFSYRVNVPGDGRDTARLRAWARDRADEEKRYHESSAAALTPDEAAMATVDPDGTVDVPDPAQPGRTVVVTTTRPGSEVAAPLAPSGQTTPGGQATPNRPEPTPAPPPPPTATPTVATRPDPMTTTPTTKPVVLMPDLFSGFTWDASAIVDALFQKGVDLGQPGEWSFGGDPKRGIVYQPAYADGVSFGADRVWSQYPAAGTPLRDGMVVGIVHWTKSYCDEHPEEYSARSNWCYESPPTQRSMTALYDRHGS